MFSLKKIILVGGLVLSIISVGSYWHVTHADQDQITTTLPTNTQRTKAVNQAKKLISVLTQKELSTQSSRKKAIKNIVTASVAEAPIITTFNATTDPNSITYSTRLDSTFASIDVLVKDIQSSHSTYYVMTYDVNSQKITKIMEYEKAVN